MNKKYLCYFLSAIVGLFYGTLIGLIFNPLLAVFVALFVGVIEVYIAVLLAQWQEDSSRKGSRVLFKDGRRLNYPIAKIYLTEVKA